MCATGKYSSANGSTSCTPCDAGSYANGTGSSFCWDCPSHAFSFEGSSHVTDCLCNAGYSGPNGGPCAACFAGTYKDVNGPSGCSACALGKYSNVMGQSSSLGCMNCPSGSFSGNGSVTRSNCTCNRGYTGPDGGPCGACEPGKFSAVRAAQNCIECGVGTYSTETATTCSICISGTFANETGSSFCWDCPFGSISGIGSVMLNNCSCREGYTGPDGIECTQCVAGTYKETNGTAPCSKCVKGKYSTETAQISESACSDCPSHALSGVGSISQVNCTCNKGYTGPDGMECEACETGSFKDVNGTAACTLCSRGKYSTVTAAISETACQGCPFYTYSPDGSGLLTNCTCNKGYTGPDGVECTSCAPGTFKDVNGSVACALCSRGKYSTSTAAISEYTCQGCPSYTSSGLGSGMLTNCSCHKGYTGQDGIQCAACFAGSYKDANGSAACTLCSQGKYSTAIAALSESTCSDCPAHTYSGVGSWLLTNCTCNKGYTGPNGAACAACIAGTYKDVNGSAPCIQCSQDKYSTAVAAISQSTCSD